MSTEPKVMRLADYRPPEFTTDHVDLNIDIHDDHTNVISKVTYQRTDEGNGATEIVLDAQANDPKSSGDYIKAVLVDGHALAEGTGYTYDAKNHKLHIPIDPGTDSAEVIVQTYLEPHNNTDLSGLYHSDDCFITQCESEGFRRITAFTDRPDVMATYRVRIEAPKDLCPVLLSNGNTFDEGEYNNGRHWAYIEDPNPKPSYLFATANGKLESVKKTMKTKSGKDVNLQVWTEPGKSDKAEHALNALETYLKWEEDNFDAEYDLENFHIVAVANFTFGAMENTGLNVFRDSLILASPETAEDSNYQCIIDVVGHEAAHKKSGNDVTLANWFNISLKEGLTVVREQMFTAFTTSQATERIGSVQMLRAAQFPDDDGPLAHPVLRPEVMSVEDDCYSMTIYQKGAEVIRMMKTMMGEDTFMDAVKHYFQKHHSQAVTIDEFVQCMEDTSGLDFSGQFYQWYTQSGRPKVQASGVYDPAAQTYTLTLAQETAPTKDQATKKPMLIPVEMGLIDANGNEMDLQLDTDAPGTDASTNRVLMFTEAKQSFTFENVTSEPAFHSLFRGYSAPVDSNPGLSTDQLRKQLMHDSDGFNRWDAGQKLAMLELQWLYDAYETTGQMPAVNQDYIESLRHILVNGAGNDQLTALALSLPGIGELEVAVKPANPVAITAAFDHLEDAIASSLATEFENTFGRVNVDDGAPYSFDFASVGKRSLKAIALRNLTRTGNPLVLNVAKYIYNHADNMTEQMACVRALRNHSGPARDAVMSDLYDRFHNDSLVIQKWFIAQASSDNDQTIDQLKTIIDSDDFSWKSPGHVGSLYRSFAGNYAQFHRPDGKGYEFYADGVIKETGFNAVTAAGMIEELCSWRDYTPTHQALMIEQLERIRDAISQAVLDDKISQKKANGVLGNIAKSLPDDEERQNVPSAPQPE